MTTDNRWLRVLSENEQDRAACDAWFRDTSDDVRVALWLAIQRMCDDENHVSQVIGRFAQLAFGEAAERNLCRPA